MSFVLDTSAILAALWSEPGADRVDDVIGEAVISAVNQAELVAKLVDRGASPAQIAEILTALNLDVADFDTTLAEVSGEMRRSTRGTGLSLGDRCCLALAMREELPVLTADRAWAELDLGVNIEVIR